MNIDKEYVQRAIDGDRDALGMAFIWGSTDQGWSYWGDQWEGKSPIDVATLKAMIGETPRLTVGETYTAINGSKWECIFVRDDTAWMIGAGGDAAYTFNANTGENLSQGGGEWSITFPETRHGTVQYINGKPDFDTWEADQ